MKQLLLTLAMLATFSATILAQDVIWTEDFAEGMNGWTANSPLCELFQSGQFGTWEIASATVGGNAVDISQLDFEWSFMTPDIYTIDWEWTDGSGEYGTIYSNYSYAGDTLLSTIEVDNVVADGLAFEPLPNGPVDWSTLIGNLPDAAMLPVRLHLMGAFDPIVAFEGTGMTMTSQDGAVVVTFERSNICGNLWYWSANSNWTLGFNGDNSGIALQSEVQNGCMMATPFYQQRLNGFAQPGGSYPEFVAELISPAIDISAADRALALEFTQTYQLLNFTDGTVPRTYLQISVDDGATFQGLVDLDPNSVANNLVRSRRDVVTIPAALIGDATSIRVKFVFAGDFYTIAIDDLSLQEREAYDLQVNQNFYAIAPNFATPWSQFTAMAFMADIQNNGGAAPTGLNLNIEITDEAGTALYNADKAYGDIVPDSLAENDFIDGAFSLNPTEGDVGSQYFGRYALTHDSTASESRIDNDSLFFDFFVTDTLFSKAPERTRNVFFTADNSYYYGNCFYTPNGDGWFARTISFAVDNADEIAGYMNNTASISLYEWPGTFNDDGAIADYELVAATEYEFTGTEAAGELITVGGLRDFLTDEPAALKDDTYYFAMVQFVAAEAEDTYVFSASEDYSYSATAFISDSLSRSTGIVPGQYGGIVEVGNPSVPEFGFINTVIPLVDMSIGLNADLSMDPLVFNDNVLPADYVIKTFPNPASEFFTLNLDLPDMQDVSVVVYDLKGQTLFFQEYDDLQTGNFQYDVTTLPAGMYFVRVSTEAGTRTLKVSVQR